MQPSRRVSGLRPALPEHVASNDGGEAARPRPWCFPLFNGERLLLAHSVGVPHPACRHAVRPVNRRCPHLADFRSPCVAGSRSAYGPSAAPEQPSFGTTQAGEPVLETIHFTG